MAALLVVGASSRGQAPAPASAVAPPNAVPAQGPEENPAVKPPVKPAVKSAVKSGAKSGVKSANGEGEKSAEEMVSFSQFSEPISLSALIDFIAEQLQVVIMQTNAKALSGQIVEFSAPIQTPKSKLLALLQTLLTPQNFALIKSPDGFYTVMPAANTPVDFSGGEFSPTRIIRTPLVDASSLKPAIETALGDSAKSVKIVYLDDLGILISTGPPPLNEAIAEVVDRIIEEIKGQQLHRIELKNIAATEAKARVLELTGQAVQAVGRPGGPAGMAAAGRAGQSVNLGNLRERLLIDRPTNALVYRGKAAEADVVRKYVEVVDTPSRLIVKRYYAGPTAGEICRVGERKGLGPVMQPAAGARAAAPGASATQFGSGFVLGAPDAQTFTYYGTDEQHKEVQGLVDEFAALSREETLVVEFYKLRNLSAQDTADLLTSLMEINTQGQTASSPFLPGSLNNQGSQRGITRLGASPFETQQQQRQQQQTAGGAGGEATGEEGTTITPAEGVSVIADVPNNQLIIRAPRRQQREFARIIERLDQRRPQVYIDVKIVSVNSSKDFQFSIDTAIGSPGSDTPIFTNFGLVPFGDSLTTPSSATGLTAAFLRNSYTPVVINALASQADARLISSPKILINDNEQAELNATKDEPFASTSQVAGAPSITSTGGNVTAGTTLQIRPTISANGTLRLEYSIELSSFGDRPNPDLPPTKLTNAFTSIVTVPSDTTIVVGGMTLDNRSNTISKVPFFGDIPLLGLVFQKQVKKKSSQTIYVFITPRILRDDSFTDLRLLTRGPMRKMEVANDTPPLAPATIPVIEHQSGGVAS